MNKQDFNNLKTYKSKHSNAHYTKNIENRVISISKIFDFAYEYLSDNFCKINNKIFDLYFYEKQSDLVDGLCIISGFKKEWTKYFEKRGAPRPINEIIHVSPFFQNYEIIHELTHTFIECISIKVAENISWLDEGLAEYYGHIILSKISGYNEIFDSKIKNIVTFYKDQQNYKNIINFDLFKDDKNWINFVENGKRDVLYNESFIIITEIINRYGIEKIKTILSEIESNIDFDIILYNNLNIKEHEINIIYNSLSIENWEKNIKNA